VKRGSPARRRRRRSSNSSSPRLTPPSCHPDRPFGELHERRGSRRVRQDRLHRPSLE
jgi:hypothetical protein